MRILIMGGEGMLGHKVFEVLSSRFEVFSTFRSSSSPHEISPLYEKISRKYLFSKVDALNFDTVERVFKKVKPGIVINCIGIVKQLKEAEDHMLCIEVNSLFPHKLARLCVANNARLFQISTDCVFSGKKGNYNESDIPDPVDLYGRSKLLGEVEGEGCLTIRTSLIGREIIKKSSLLEWFLEQRGRKIKGYTHAIFSGVTTAVLARIIGNLIVDYPRLCGIYHVASNPVSKYDLLVMIRNAMGLNIEIEPSEEYFCDRSLNPARFLSQTGYSIPSWEEMISELVVESKKQLEKGD